MTQRPPMKMIFSSHEERSDVPRPSRFAAIAALALAVLNCSESTTPPSQATSSGSTAGAAGNGASGAGGSSGGAGGAEPDASGMPDANGGAGGSSTMDVSGSDGPRADVAVDTGA